MALAELEFDEVGEWSEIKLAILEKYARAYNTILRSKKQKSTYKTIYIDGFAGAGHHLTKSSKEVIKGSPVRALEVKPPFDWLHFIDMDNARTAELRRLSADQPNVTVHSGDANAILLDQVFPTVQYRDYKRGLCILDPYGLDLDWKVIEAAGRSRTIEIFLNFPSMDMNRNVLWHAHERVSQKRQSRMTRFWGDESWKDAAYSGAGNLFGDLEKTTNQEVAEAFRRRLRDVAGFKYVPKPRPMKNSNGAIVYYLFFAAHKELAADIVESIFRREVKI